LPCIPGLFRSSFQLFYEICRRESCPTLEGYFWRIAGLGFSAMLPLQCSRNLFRCRLRVLTKLRLKSTARVAIYPRARERSGSALSKASCPPQSRRESAAKRSWFPKALKEKAHARSSHRFALLQGRVHLFVAGERAHFISLIALEQVPPNTRFSRYLHQ
jgi:hypothetical protein